LRDSEAGRRGNSEEHVGPFDDNTLESIAELICGTDGPRYRQGWELPRFLRQAGWADVPDYDDGGRKQWILELLCERRDDGHAIEQVLLRLASPIEYRDDPTVATVVAQRLNKTLALEACKITYEGGKPILVALPDAMIAPDTPAPVVLKEDIGKFIRDPALTAILRVRLDEASTCREHGASLAAVVLLGSILEGALLDVAMRFPRAAMSAKAAPRENGRVPKIRQDTQWDLNKLIDVAHELHWIQADVKEFAHSLRTYRNLIHPDAQRKKIDLPDRDTVNLCWNVVIAALNDLGRSIDGSLELAEG
jgi:hypothetical protein